MTSRERIDVVVRRLPRGVHEAVPPSFRRWLRHRLGRYYAWEGGFDPHHTPLLGEGESNGPPEFVGIGVQKAGTSWWYRLIVIHPGVSVHPSIHKERHFFTRFGTHTFGSAEVAAYHEWFPRRVGTITGEWTPDYFNCPWAPPLVRQAAPDAKLLVILRDPLQRFVSNLAYRGQDAGDHIGAKLVQALRRSLYAEDLRRWQSYFPVDQLLVLQYEMCASQPGEQLARTYEFLGLDPSFRPPNLRSRINMTERTKIELPPDARRRLEEIVAPDAAELAKLEPSIDLSLWPSATPG